MTRTLRAVYEKGVLRPLEPLDLREQQLVHVTVSDEAPPAGPPDGDAFQALVREWKATRGHTSSAARMAKNPAYQKIIGLGEAAVPLILAELRKEPDHWFVALHTITGADPVPPESRGKVAEMAAAWLAWGKERRYIP
jgi:AF2212-like protein